MRLLLALLAAQHPTTATSTRDLYRALERGDLVTVERGRALRAERGEVVELGALGLLGDLSRFVRCLPLGPVPEDREDHAAARRLLRLERIRLEQVLRDGKGEAKSLVELLGDPPLFQTAAAVQPELVRWPIEEERWGGEVIEARLEPRACPAKPGALPGAPGQARHAEERARAALLREGYSRALDDLPRLPPRAAGLLAFAYLRDAQADPLLVLPEVWARALEDAARGAGPPHRTPSLLLLARLSERTAGGLARAARLYRQVLAEPESTPEEDGRARVRLLSLLEGTGTVDPPWEEIARLSEEARGPRPADRAALDYGQARALYALGRFEALKSFGRRYLLSTERDDGARFASVTRDLLARLALVLDPVPAIDWIHELAVENEGETTARMDQVGKLALEAGRLDLATAIYDRLRVQAAERRAAVGPGASADLARWIAARARVEFAQNDPAAFAGFTDELVALASRERTRPLARFAPHREVARLSQDLLGRLVNEVPADPERRKFAALLLEASAALAGTPNRWRPQLEAQLAPLTALAGPYAAGRGGKPAKDPRAVERKKKERPPVRQLGEIIVPRLPPHIEAADLPTELPALAAMVVSEDESGALQLRVPWAALAAARAEAKAAKKPKQ